MTKKVAEKAQESLVKTSEKGSIELTEGELKQVAGGQKNKTDNKTSDYLVVNLADASIME